MPHTTGSSPTGSSSGVEGKYTDPHLDKSLAYAIAVREIQKKGLKAEGKGREGGRL